jgi:hypothetical protein
MKDQDYFRKNSEKRTIKFEVCMIEKYLLQIWILDSNKINDYSRVLHHNPRVVFYLCHTL